MKPEELKAARQTRGLRLRQVSEILNLSIYCLADFERGTVKPCSETLEDLRALYGFSSKSKRNEKIICTE